MGEGFKVIIVKPLVLKHHIPEHPNTHILGQGPRIINIRNIINISMCTISIIIIIIIITIIIMSTIRTLLL